jgi:DNA polymerase V
MGNQGACVIARSYEMKARGVKVGEPIWDAVKKCSDGIYIKRDFPWYGELSRRMFEALETFSDRREYYSIDEFFWKGHQSGRSWQQTAEDVRAHIRAKVGVPMTVSYARTRTLAKLFADASKPNGAIAVTDEGQENAMLTKLPVTEISGIGKRRAAKLAGYGIHTCLDFKKASGFLIRKLLTVVGHDLWREINGDPATPIRTVRPRRKMISRGGSLAGHVKDAFQLYGWLARNCERLIEELHFSKVRPWVLRVYVSYHDAPGAGGTIHLNVPTDNFGELMDAARQGLRKAWRQGEAATHMHLVAERLVRPTAWQRSLFETDEEAPDPIAELKRQVNDKFGRFTLRSGATLYANDFYQDPANLCDICDLAKGEKFCF